MQPEDENRQDIAPEWRALDNVIDAENSYAQQQAEGNTDSIDPETMTTDQAVKGGPGDYSWGGFEDQKKEKYGSVKPDHVDQEAWDKRVENDLIGRHFPGVVKGLEDVVSAGSIPALGVADFISDAVGLVPWLKPIDNWWDKNSPRHAHPAHTLARDASSIIIPTMYGGSVITGSLKGATSSMTMPSYIRTLGNVAAWTGVDTSVAAISSHSTTDDNMGAVLGNWLGWDVPWATRSSDSPDIRYKKNVFEAALLSGSVELLGATFAFARKTKLIPRDGTAAEVVARRTEAAAKYDNPLSEAVDSSVEARKAAQLDEMEQAIKADPTGKKYNSFVNDLGPDDAGRAVINTQPDPLMAKVHHTQIQNNIDTVNGRAVAVVDEGFNRDFLHAIDGNSRAKQLDKLFDSISPNVDAVVNERTIKAEQMNRAVDNLTNAIHGKDLSLKEFEFIVDDMKTTVFNSNQILDEEQWVIASQAFKNAYDKLFDPNQMRASAMLTQQAGDNVADTAAAVKMLGEQVDTTRQMNIIFDKLNLLGQEVGINQYIVKKAREYQKLKEAGDINSVLQWLKKTGPEFDDYIKDVKVKGNKLNETLKDIAENNPHYYKAFVEAYDATNGSVDELHKLQRLAEENIGFIKKGFIDMNPKVPSQLIKQLHAARINGILSGLAPARALLGNATMTAIKPAAIMAGALSQGDIAAFKRATWVFGGIEENFRRGLKVMKRDWDLAVKNPEAAMLRGRTDLKQAKLDQFEYMNSVSQAWETEGAYGWQAKTGLWNLTKGVSWWNNNKFIRWGTNALFAIDGMTNSFMASGVARARAYDSLAKDFNGAVNFKAFQAKQKDLYAQAFDSTGLLTDTAAKYASQEIALNLDNEMVKAFQDFLDYVPAARGLFLFPKTGANSVQLGWTFNPLSSVFKVELPKVKKVFNATTDAEKLEALANHGIEISKGGNWKEAFNSLKYEYIGRQLMGSTLVMAVGTWALLGNMTGNGPQDGAERQRMLRMGWQPRSIKNPITGDWHSYEGFEPFASLMGLTSDVVYQSNRIDQAVQEDLFRKIAFSVSMNITNDTFISGFKPLVDMLTSDPTAFQRYLAQQFDQTFIPFRGIRSILNNAISPGLRDVNNDFMSYLANANKFIMPTGEDAMLPELVDVFTGKPIKAYEKLTQAGNALLPTFKVNGDMEPWRQWLLSTGWDSMSRLRVNKFTKQPLSAHDRHFINNWIGKNANLKGQIIKLMTENDGYFQRKMKEYGKVKGKVPVKDWIVHRELDRILDSAYDAAWYQLEAYNAEQGYSTQGRELKMLKHELRRGDSKAALETRKRLKALHNMAK
mgnify:CR=1 FL=1